MKAEAEAELKEFHAQRATALQKAKAANRAQEKDAVAKRDKDLQSAGQSLQLTIELCRKAIR